MSNLLNRWKEGLAKTSRAAFGQIANLLGATEISPDTWEELEGLLVQADIGMETTDVVLDALEKRVDREGMTRSSQLYAALRQSCAPNSQLHLRLSLPKNQQSF